jgi:phosphatidylglycerophosphate synthase
MPVLGAFPLWILIVVFGREALITLLRSLLASRGTVVPAGKSGKLKAVFQNIFIGAAILWYALQSAATDRGWDDGWWVAWRAIHGFVLLASLAIAIVLTVYSMVVYLWQWRRLVREVV